MKNLLFAISIILSFSVNAKESFDNWLEKIITRARDEGIKQEIIDKSFSDIKLDQVVVKLDNKQPYKTLTIEQYLNRVVPQSRINKANKNYIKNKTIIDEVAAKYKVDKSVIVALWGVESNFGQNQGNFNIIESLATLAYDGRREKFFTKELFNALKILNDGHITPEKMIGSWAGAMGQTQFMPSSFLSLAVDYNNDGKKDIWTTKPDIFASIANYLSKSNWKYKDGWGAEVKIPSNFSDKYISIKQTKTVKEWKKLGIKFTNKTIDNNKNASLIRVDDNNPKYFLVLNNFKTILKWNRSLYFATAIGILSDNIGN